MVGSVPPRLMIPFSGMFRSNGRKYLGLNGEVFCCRGGLFKFGKFAFLDLLESW